MPCRMIEWVCPPQTSMIAHCPVVAAWIRSSRPRARPGSPNSSRYLTAPTPPGGRPVRPAELLLEDAEPLERRQGLAGRLLVQPLDGEADVDDDVLADLRLGEVGEADLLADAAEVDLRHGMPSSSCTDTTRPGTARHIVGSCPGAQRRWSRRFERTCADGHLSQGQAPVVGGDLFVDEDRQAVLGQRPGWPRAGRG